MSDEKFFLLKFSFADTNTSYYKVPKAWIDRKEVWDSTWVRIGDDFINMENVTKVEVEDLDSAWGGGV